MTDYKTLSSSELTEALNFHRRQRNMSRGINEAAHMRQTQVVRLLEAEEASRLEEAVSVEKHNYHWGKMITVHHGSSHSFPLHPEHQEKIKNLKDGESTGFKDETGNRVTASREGDKVHLKTSGAGSSKTTVAHSHFTEETQIDENGIKGWKNAASNNMKKYNNMPWAVKDTLNASRRVVNRNTGVSVANKKLGTYPADKAKAKVMAREEFELDEQTMPGNVALRLVDRHQAAAFHHKKNGNMKGYAAHIKVAGRIEDAVIRAGRDMPVKSKQLEAASDKAFSEHPHRIVRKEEVVMNEAASYRDSGAQNMMRASRKADKEADKMRAQQAKADAKKASKTEEFTEESNLRITKVYYKWPKPATYAVHNADRSYHKEFKSMEDAQAHKDEKSK